MLLKPKRTLVTPQLFNIGRPRRPTFYEVEEIAYSEIPGPARKLIADRLRASDLRARDRARRKRTLASGGDAQC